VTARIGIADYGTGNIWSVQNALLEIGAEAEVVGQPEKLAHFDKLILPGVGAFGDAMQRLRETGMDQALTEQWRRGKPIMGVCLGMQLMCRSSTEEGLHEGLGWFDAEVVALPNKPGIKIPHMGWNSVSFTRENPLTSGVPNPADYYFVHSFQVVCRQPEDALGICHHGTDFTAMIARDTLVAAQFHPEKSQRCGLHLLKNFTERF